MKKAVLFFSITFFALTLFAQNRYLDEVFTNVTVTDSVQYGQNFGFMTGAPVLQPLIMTMYEPTGDWLSTRPLVVYLHTGSFLPILINGTPTGDMHDSATVEMCKQFARRGYVAVSMDYRVGWNPLSAEIDVRKGTLLQGVYRALQDARTCVRYFKMTAQIQSNPWRVDTSRIILVGQGSGGYVALAYATLKDLNQIALLKFIATTDQITYGIFANQPYVLGAIWGDPDGFGGDPTLNHPNWPGYTNNVHFAVNMGGALGDSSWLKAGDVPMVCFHVPNDPFAPYDNGPVIVPTTGQFVVDVSGSHRVIRMADSLGNNASFNLPFTDPYTTRANMVNDGYYGLFPFVLPDPGPPFHGQAGPWEWWDSSDLVAAGGPSLAYAAIAGGLLTNPDMSKTKALHYIDSIMGYLHPRLAASLDLDTQHIDIGIPQVNTEMAVNMFPNPAVSYFTLQLDNPAEKMQYFKLLDLTGRVIMEISNINAPMVKIAREDLTNGLYLVKIGLKDKELNGKLMLQ